jgi:acyl carrier protein
MAVQGRDQIFDDLTHIISSLSEDWELSDPITEETYLIKDLGFESIDIVILCTNVEQHYNRQIPFAEFLAQIGQREVRDIRMDELVEFFYRHLQKGTPP